MSRHKLDKKIVKYRVQKPEAEKAAEAERQVPARERLRKEGSGKVVWMHEKLERPEVLIATTSC
jgi:hypothetical protein